MTVIGYIFKQKYAFDDKEKGVHREGYTTYAVTHTLSESGEIVRTYTTKCAPDFKLKVGDKGNPMFDSFSRLVALM